MFLRQFPQTRLRRLRQNASLRKMVQENHLSASDLILPVFVLEGKQRNEPIESLADAPRLSLDLLLNQIPQWLDLGICCLALFPVIHPEKKTHDGIESINPEGLMSQTLQTIKAHYPEMLLIADIALDPFTSHGQDGLIDHNGHVLNDQTIEALSLQALCYAKAGADILAPSDMMDGRIRAIREILEKNNYKDTIILSYAAKYASAFYGPFRDAVGSSQALGQSDKKTYQLNPANAQEALHEVALDLSEGADWVMVKPGLPYLDLIYRIKTQFQVPTAAYQVSGEYAMLLAAHNNQWLDFKTCYLESLICFKRAGADMILTYGAIKAASWLRDKS
jgi:porphobilinogen synthase